MKRTTISLITISIICIILIGVSLSKGGYPLSLEEMFEIIKNPDSNALGAKVLFHLRIPRVMMGLGAGLALGLAGAVYQLVFANPLASPDITGVSSGASLGAAIAIVLGANTTIHIMFGAFIASLLTLAFVIGLVKTTGTQKSSTYILSGLIISSLVNAGIMFVKYIADPQSQLAAIDFWIMGSLGSVTSSKMIVSLSSALIPFGLILFFQKPLTLLLVGDENATYMGLNVKWFRSIILLITTWMVASIVAISGVISFIGLIAPHLTYLILRTRNKYFLVFSSLVGGCIVLFGDLLARTVVAGAELPLSIFTILISIPFLIFWFYKQRSTWL